MSLVSPPRASPFCQTVEGHPRKKEPKRLAPHTGPTKPGYPHELPRHGGPPRGYVPVARGALATSMSHDLLSGGFARPSEGAFRCARMLPWKSKSKSQSERAFALRRSELAREPRSHWVIPLRASASAVRDGAASRVRGNDGVEGWCRASRPLRTAPSPFRERAGERVADSAPTPLPTLTPLPRKREREPSGMKRNHEAPYPPSSQTHRGRSPLLRFQDARA
ncbi:hypothetical protein SAMN05216577_11547 [Pseudomonas citronellolis]|uniref:Uncharacterized protein n=1 Tax=Pseudomonas citronellolis TaxID=53408 RepID=A0AAQ1HNS4_9PSED|nr:hypothetical protein SAMN05216577_11547 [Pseudomonas citronellolis]